MAKSQKAGAKLERARARANEELNLAREKAKRKISKAQTVLRAAEEKIRKRLEKQSAKIERKRGVNKLAKRAAVAGDASARRTERDHLDGRSGD
jgi:DNA-binding transcriptional regulator GbsR (MarR family)